MNRSGLDIQLLISLDALIAEKGVSKAALRLHLSQPAVSSQLGRLRELFRDPLLYRSGREMLPTLRAQELAIEIKQLLAAIDRLAQPSQFEPLQSKATFNLAATDLIEFTHLPQIVAHLGRHAPEVKLEVSPLNLPTIAKQMERGDIDICITARRNAPPELHSRTLYADRVVCIVRKNHPSVTNRLSLDTFCQLKHATITPDRLAAEVDKYLAGKGLHRTVSLTVPHFFMLPEIVSTSDMIAMVARRLAERFSHRLGIFKSPLDLELERFEVTLLWHERTHRDPAHSWLRQLFANAIEQKRAKSLK